MGMVGKKIQEVYIINLFWKIVKFKNIIIGKKLFYKIV